MTRPLRSRAGGGRRSGPALVRLALAACLAVFSAVSAVPAAATLPAIGPGGDVPTLAPVLRRVTPAVVNIAVLSRQPVQMNPLLRDPFFRRFFNVPDDLPRERPRISAGSGVIVDAVGGYVLTNQHVVQNASEIAVTLKDRRRLEAELVGSDPATDVAVLKIDPKDLTALPFGDSEALEVGDFVLAIGNPFGLGQTVTSGIISALGRSGLRVDGFEDFIQTDASINPGNSGGALVDLHGRLIGINTAIIAPSGGNVGIGFAIPSRIARAVMDQIIRYGDVHRGQLGVSIQDVTPDIAEALGLDRAAGALVAAVQPGSAAAQAGLQSRDVIVAVDGEPVDGAGDLRNHIGLTPVGSTLELRLLRGGRVHSVRVRLTGR
ncbi:MAG: Do family serine endopeptidase [Rhodospirillales bacterium]|nr:Do family serine endopeptidase [Rhodospirillales bacterium]